MNKWLVVFLLGSTLLSCKTGKQSVANKTPVKSSAYIRNFHEGVRLKLNNQVDEAIEKFNLCLKENQKDDGVHFALSQLFLIKEDVITAAFHTQKAAEIDPNNEHYQSELAYMYSELGKHEQAALAFEKLYKQKPRATEFYLGAAESWVKTGKLNKAVAVYDQMQKFMGKNPEIIMAKFKMYQQAKDDKNAFAMLLLGRDEFPDEPIFIANLVDFYMQRDRYNEGVIMLRELTLADPDNGLAKMMLGDILYQNKQRDEGLKLMKDAIKMDGPTLDQKMNVLLAFQHLFAIDRDFESLVEYMVKRYPKSAKAHSIQGDYFIKNNQEKDALWSYRQAVKADPNLYPIWNQVLLMGYQQQVWDTLLVDSEKCIELFPIQPFPYFTAGVVYNQMKNHEKAIERLNEGMDLIVKDANLEAETWGQIGEAYFGLGQYEKAKMNYLKAIEKSPQSLFLKNNFAFRLALHQEDLKKAREMVEHLSKEKPNDPRFLSTQGFLLLREKKYEEALKVLESANAFLPNDKIILDFLGDALWWLGQKNDAVEKWKLAQQAGSTNQKLNDKIQSKSYYEPMF
jgi:tetratricopeptide (TPR) repeat protein